MLYYVHQLKCDLNIYILKLKTESYLDRKQGLWKQSRSWENQKNELKGAERRPSVASGDNSTRVHHMSNVFYLHIHVVHRNYQNIDLCRCNSGIFEYTFFSPSVTNSTSL